MQASQPEFKRGQIYAIINKKQDFALRAQQSIPQKCEDSRINGAPFNPQDDNQLFIIQKIRNEGYQIINLLTNLVLTVEGKEIRLEFGKQKSSQLFTISKSPFHGFYFYYWIKNASEANRSLYFSKFLKQGPFNASIDDQMFRFEPVDENNLIQQTFILLNKHSNKVLDVPRGTYEEGERIIQYDINHRFNQRWRWIPANKGYLIQNLLTKLYLDIQGQSRKSGAAVIQWTKTANTNQLWIPEQVGNGSYRIRSMHQPSLLIGIKGDSIQNCGKLQVTNQNGPSVFWIIQGALP